MNVLQLSRCANARLSAYHGHMATRDNRDERAQEMWNEYLYWLNLYAMAMHAKTGTPETALLPLDRILDTLITIK